MSGLCCWASCSAGNPPTTPPATSRPSSLASLRCVLWTQLLASKCMEPIRSSIKRCVLDPRRIMSWTVSIPQANSECAICLFKACSQCMDLCATFLLLHWPSCLLTHDEAVRLCSQGALLEQLNMSVVRQIFDSIALGYAEACAARPQTNNVPTSPDARGRALRLSAPALTPKVPSLQRQQHSIVAQYPC